MLALLCNTAGATRALWLRRLLRRGVQRRQLTDGRLQQLSGALIHLHTHERLCAVHGLQSQWGVVRSPPSASMRDEGADGACRRRS